MQYEEVVRDFAARTKENLRVIEELHDQGKNVFEVTQLINSMVGLLVFPQQEYIDSIPSTPIDDLLREGWPIPRVRGKFEQVTDLNCLVRYLRNAIAHFHIEFIGDSERSIKVLRVWNITKSGSRNWDAELTVDELRCITTKFIDLLLGPLPSSQKK